EAIDRPAAHPRKRANRLLQALALADEQRPDEVARMKPAFGEELADPGSRPAAPHPQRRVGWSWIGWNDHGTGSSRDALGKESRSPSIEHAWPMRCRNGLCW